MKTSVSAADIINDIEFELIQGSLSRDDLGQGIQTIRKFQSELRRQTFDSTAAKIDLNEVLSRQFQLNDMLLTLLQETAAAIQENRYTLLQAAQTEPDSANNSAYGQQQSNGSTVEGRSASPIPERDKKDLRAVMDPDRLKLVLDMQPSTVPIIGSFIKRLRTALHNLVLYYIRLLAQKQRDVNQTLADWALYLDSVDRNQGDEVELLRNQMAMLHKRLQAIEGKDEAPNMPA